MNFSKDLSAKGFSPPNDLISANGSLNIFSSGIISRNEVGADVTWCDFVVFFFLAVVLCVVRNVVFLVVAFVALTTDFVVLTAAVDTTVEWWVGCIVVDRLIVVEGRDVVDGRDLVVGW